jgi:peptidoglycan hydrolase-like protein with peptidoglycan-binding domain
MLKIKSKAILAFAGLMVAAFVFAAVPTASADMVTLPTTGVSKSSSMSNIQALQTFLNWNLGSQIVPLVVDGVYGAKTTAAIKLFQSQNGLVADGIFGRLSAAKAMALQANAGGVVYPAGCASNSGYSSTTGLPCAGGALPAGCSSTAGYSTTTGVACSSSVGTSLPAGCATAAGYSSTTGQPCSTTTVNSGTNGYLADFSSDSTNRVSTVYESEQNKVVAGFRATARLADQTVTRVRATFVNTDSGSSANLAKYISGATLWYGSQALATMSVAQADRATSSDTYTFNFSGINAKIAKDQIGRFYVSLNANGSMDSADTDSANWTVTFTAGGVSANSPDGSSDTYPSSDIAQTGVMFGKFAAQGVKATVALSSSNPDSSTVSVQNSASTNAVTLLKFTIKATNSDMTVRKIPVQISSTTANVSSIINTLKLYRGANLVDSVDGGSDYEVTGGAIDIDDTTIATGTTVGYLFGNMSDPYNKIAAGETVEFSVVADIKQVTGNYSEGDTLTASVDSDDVISTTDLAFSINDVNGDQLTRTSAYRVGSAVGQIQTLRVNGVNTVMGATSTSKTTDTNGNVTSVTYTIPVAVTAFGQTLYMGQTAQVATSMTSTNAFAVVFENSSAPTTSVVTSMTNSITLSSVDADIESNGFRLDSGTTKNFVIKVTLTDPAVYNSSYRVRVAQIQTWTNGALTTGNSISNLLPQVDYRTGYELINS